MSSAQQETCFLCGASAKWKSTDFENRRHYLCSSSECGEYEISNHAMKRLEESSELKSGLSPLAASNHDASKILEIVIESPGEKLISRIVDKRPRL